MKNHEMKRMLEQNLPYPKLTIRADQRFDAICQRLPDRMETEPAGRAAARHWGAAPVEEEQAAVSVRAHGGRTALKLSLGLAALVLVSLTVLNLTFPNVAESIPGLGEAFRALNGKFTMGNNSPTYPDLIQPVDVKAEAPLCNVTVAEAYSEGKYVFLSLKLTSQDETVNTAKFLSPQFIYDEDQQGYRKEYSVTVDGQQVELLREIVFEKGEDGYTGTGVIALPEKAEHGQKLQVELRLDALRGLKEGTDYHWDTSPEVEIEEPVSLSFEVTANTTYNKEGTSGLTVDNVTLESYESTPSLFSVKLRYPGVPLGVLSTLANEGSVQARTEDGTKLRPVGEASLVTPEHGECFLGDEVTYTVAFNGVPEGTKQVTVTLMDVDPDESGWVGWVDGGYIVPCVFGEFTVDLETGEVAASEAYRDRGLEKFPIQDYISAIKAGPQFTNHLLHGESSLGYGRLIVSDGEVGFADETNDTGSWRFTFYTDTEMELPYEVRFYRDGELYQAVPIRMTEDAIETSYGPAVVRDEYAVQMMRTNAEDELPEAVKRYYAVTVYLDALEVASGTGDTIDRYQVQIVNTETREVVFDSNDPWPEHTASEFAPQAGS